MQYFSYLSDDDIRYVHEASLEILAETGLLVRNEKARHRFAEHGARVDHDSCVSRTRWWKNTAAWCHPASPCAGAIRPMT